MLAAETSRCGSADSGTRSCNGVTIVLRLKSRCPQNTLPMLIYRLTDAHCHLIIFPSSPLQAAPMRRAFSLSTQNRVAPTPNFNDTQDTTLF